MAIGIIGKKVGMTHIFDSDGNPMPVTLIAAGPCKVSQIKTIEKDGYSAVQLAFDPVLEKRISKPELGHLGKSGIEPLRVLREFRVDASEITELKAGDTIDVTQFKVGDIIDVIAASRGRGFTGVMKRHNHGGAATSSHGTHETFRHGGSIGGRFPQHVIKGMKMAGRHGGKRVTVQKLQIADVRPEHNILAVRGGVPGAPSGYVIVRTAKKAASVSR